MAKLSFEYLADELKKQKARWQPMETEVSKKGEKARKKLLGVQLPPGFTFPAPKASTRSLDAPGFAPAVDWRNRNGNHVTPVKHQGGCGSCVSFCTVAVVESMASIEHNQLLNLSESDQHFCSSHGANCNGWWPVPAFEQIQSRGVCDEASFPYDEAFPDNNIWAGPPSCKLSSDRDNKAVKITNITTVTSANEAKEYLDSTGPLSAVIEVYSDFYNYQSGIYSHTTGDLEGLHCVQLIGYNESQQYWICKNSWGTGWGEGGYFKIAYGNCKIDAYPKTGCSGVVLPDTSEWHGWENLGGKITSQPNAVCWDKNRIDVVARGLDSGVYHRWWNGSSWQGWEDLGGKIQGAPSISSWDDGRLDIFATGLDYQLYHKWYQGGWSGWSPLGGMLTSAPSAVSWGPNRIDIFARGTDSAMWHIWWDGSRWHSWENLGGVITSAPAVCSQGDRKLDCFARGTDNKLWQKSFNRTSGWSGWSRVSNDLLMGAPSAVSTKDGNIEVFFRGTKYHMMRKTWNGTSWTETEDLGGVLSSDIGVCSWEADRIDCFAEGMDSSMYHKWHTSS